MEKILQTILGLLRRQFDDHDEQQADDNQVALSEGQLIEACSSLTEPHKSIFVSIFKHTILLDDIT